MTYPKGYCAIIDGKKVGDECLAKILFERACKNVPVIANIVLAMDYATNIENLNNVQLYNAISCLCYDFIGVFNNSIDKFINSAIEKMVSDGLVREW